MESGVKSMDAETMNEDSMIARDTLIILKKKKESAEDDPHCLFAYNFSLSIEKMMQNPSMEKEFRLGEKLNGKLCETTTSQFTSTSSLIENDEVVYDDSLQDGSFESDRFN